MMLKKSFIGALALGVSALTAVDASAEVLRDNRCNTGYSEYLGVDRTGSRVFNCVAPPRDIVIQNAPPPVIYYPAPPPVVIERGPTVGEQVVTGAMIGLGAYALTEALRGGHRHGHRHGGYHNRHR